MKPKNIELNIEELVLHGFVPGDRHRIGEAVEQELTRLLADRGVPQSLERGGEIGHVDGGAFEVAQGSRPQVVGAKVAKAVYGGLRQ
ncbi:MAG TPA: hypothetical protein VMW20_08545 [Candidatus Nanoarchaeia archaeon]|nr:hypothetical protein [Candidatus Nanoarchaeia archaeon]